MRINGMLNQNLEINGQKYIRERLITIIGLFEF